MQSLSLASLPDLPKIASNFVADAPAARRLGHALFFDPRLSANGKLSCASCHLPALAFTDGRARSSGLGAVNRNAQTLVGVGYATWLFWDGRRDSVWAQALAPIEAANELGLTRLEAARLIAEDVTYAAEYAALFGERLSFAVSEGWPLRASPFGDASVKRNWFKLTASQRSEVNRAFSNLGRVLEAYQRLLLPGESAFDGYVSALQRGDESAANAIFSHEAKAGLRLFLDVERTQCLECHNGPLLTNQSFHKTGTDASGELPDLGRYLGAQALFIDEFNCQGAYSGVAPDDCDELKFMNRTLIGEQVGAFKTPSLRNLSKTKPFFHSGEAASLAEVIQHYRVPPETPGHELRPLVLSDHEALELEAFLRSLNGDLSTDPRWLAPPTPRVLSSAARN